jgi:hypothetical protein
MMTVMRRQLAAQLRPAGRRSDVICGRQSAACGVESVRSLHQMPSQPHATTQLWRCTPCRCN